MSLVENPEQQVGTSLALTLASFGIHTSASPNESVGASTDASLLAVTTWPQPTPPARNNVRVQRSERSRDLTGFDWS